MDDRAGPNVLLVGIDAACQDVLDPLLEGGHVPTLASLLESGASGPLASRMPPWTPSAWPSMYTGVNPGKHGVFGFLAFDGYDWDVVNFTHVRELALWELLDHHGLSSVVVNVPVTHPPDPISGAIVPGYTAPNEPACHPDGLLDRIRDEIGDYRVYAPETDDRAEQIEWYRRLTRMRGEAFRHLCAEFDPEFGFVQFQQTDTVFHERPTDGAAIEAVYAAVDDEIATILDRYEPELVVVASDHGIGPYGGHEFRVNDYLRTRGFVEATRDGHAKPSWHRLKETKLASPDSDGVDATRSNSLLERVATAAARFGLTSQHLDAALSTLGLRDLALRITPDSVVAAAAERVDHPRSRAYMRNRIECGVRVNLAGREPSGTVPESEYEAIRDALIDLFERVETPAGDPVFERVVRREAVFHGPYVNEAPDVVLVPNDFDEFLSATLRGQAFGAPSEPYNHKFEGLFALAGPDIDASAAWPRPTILDVAPTICAALGVPRNDRMDGTPLPVVDPTSEMSYPQQADDSDRAHSAGESVEARLDDLGYLG